MPILHAETSIYPEDLFDAPPGADPADHNWLAIYTRSRQEKALARFLLARQLPFYLPLISKSWLSRGRQVTSQIPLFTGYVFLLGSDEQRPDILKSNRISRILEVSDHDRLWHDLRQIQQLIASSAPLSVESRLIPGQRVRVRSGSFAGVEGTVLKRRGKTRLMVSVDFLQQGASVQVDDFVLEPI